MIFERCDFFRLFLDKKRFQWNRQPIWFSFQCHHLGCSYQQCRTVEMTFIIQSHQTEEFNEEMKNMTQLTNSMIEFHITDWIPNSIGPYSSHARFAVFLPILFALGRSATCLHQGYDPSKSFSCFDTSEETLLWCNRTDALGLVCAPFVLCIFAFAALSIYLFFQDGYLSNIDTLILSLLLLIAVWCHLKVMFTDPGAVPKMAKPIPRDQHLPHVMCGRCDSYKPPLSHHGEASSNSILYKAFD